MKMSTLVQVITWTKVDRVLCHAASLGASELTLKLDSYFVRAYARVCATLGNAEDQYCAAQMRCEFWVWTYERIHVQITMASISVGWAWPSQTHLIGWNINAGLESSTRLNSSAYVRAHTRAELYAGSMNGSAYARVYARIRAHTRARSMNPALKYLYEHSR